MMTLHASALLDFQTTVCRFCTQRTGAKACLYLFIFHFQADVSKVIEIRDGPEGLTKEIIDAKLLA
jgi:hypothetical protein